MTIQMFNPGSQDKTMQCPHCQQQFKLLYRCNGCNLPVCHTCVLLKQPDKPRMVAFAEIDFFAWLEADTPQDELYCPTCR